MMEYRIRHGPSTAEQGPSPRPAVTGPSGLGPNSAGSHRQKGQEGPHCGHWPALRCTEGTGPMTAWNGSLWTHEPISARLRSVLTNQSCLDFPMAVPRDSDKTAQVRRTTRWISVCLAES